MKRAFHFTVAALTLMSGISYAATPLEKTNKLVTYIHYANLAEVELGQLAVSKAQNQSVKDYAQQMISAHQEADQKLLKLVDSEKLNIKAKSADKLAEKREKLMKATGADFDKQYIICMIEKHDKLLGKLKSAQSWLPEGPINTLTVETIPIVDHHLMMAKQIQKDLNDAKK